MRKLLAVLGIEVGSSLSPMMHSAAFSAHQLDLAYIPVNAASESEFFEKIDALRQLSALGANVTMPYKKAALTICNELSPAAAQIGAVNTLHFTASGKVVGHNTDGPGLIQVLRGYGLEQRSRVQVLGAGGVARAALWSLMQLQTEEIFLCRRNGNPAEKDPLWAEAEQVRPQALAPIAEAGLVISCLPGTPELAEQICTEWLAPASGRAVLDLAYRPQGPSHLLQRAQEKGYQVDDGRGLLVAQGALSLCEWTGQDASVFLPAMRSALGLSADA